MNDILGPIRQNGHVVKDLRAAVKYWTEVMGVGPFFLLDRITMPSFTYQGQPANPCISVAFSQHGSLQIELIEPHDDEPSMFRDFLESGQQGLHHVACWTMDYDRDKARMLERGFEVGHASEGDSDDELVSARFCYVFHKDIPGMIVEILERTLAGDFMQERIEEATLDWDGSDPLRPVEIPVHLICTEDDDMTEALTTEQKAHRAWARGEITELPGRYCWGVAHGDADYLVDLFTADGSFDARVFDIGFPKGHDELRAYFAKYTPPRMRFPMVHNVIITALGDTDATGTCMAEVLSKKGDGFVTSPGMYEDQYRLVGGVWKFASRRIIRFEFVQLDEGLVKVK